MSFSSTIFEGVASKVIISLTSSLVTSGLSVLLNSLKAGTNTESLLTRTTAFGAITFLLVFSGLIVWQYIRHYIILVPKRMVDREYMSYVTGMSYESRERARMHSELTCKFNVTIKSFPLSYSWTGSGSEPFSETPDAVLSSYTNDRNQKKWQLDFHAPKPAKSDIPIKYGVDAYDFGRTSKPRFGYNVYYPTKKLTIRVQFNQADTNLKIKYIYFVCRYATSDIIIENIPLDPSLNIHIKEIPNPKLFQYYGFEWIYKSE
jgi:hypothetical protein